MHPAILAVARRAPSHSRLDGRRKTAYFGGEEELLLVVWFLRSLFLFLFLFFFIRFVPDRLRDALRAERMVNYA
jgi:hypothetical protein